MRKNSNGEIEIDLMGLVRALWRNALVIILVAVLFGGLAFGYSFMFMTPMYTASTMLYVNSSVNVGGTSISFNSSELYTAQNLLNTYFTILYSRTTLEEISEEAGVPYGSSVGKMIGVEPIEGTGIFNVYVSSWNPTEAELIANTVAKVLPERLADIINGCSVRVVDYAIVPAHRSSPVYTTNVLIGALIGAVLVVVIILLKELLSAREDVLIHSSDDAAKLYPDIPVLAIIPDMRTSSKKSYYSDYSSYYGSERKAK